jgi:glucose uptake protein GlcU
MMLLMEKVNTLPKMDKLFKAFGLMTYCKNKRTERKNLVFFKKNIYILYFYKLNYIVYVTLFTLNNILYFIYLLKI